MRNVKFGIRNAEFGIVLLCKFMVRTVFCEKSPLQNANKTFFGGHRKSLCDQERADIGSAPAEIRFSL